jgi:hypothetical protein
MKTFTNAEWFHIKGRGATLGWRHNRRTEMIYAIVIWMATAATGGYACSAPMPLPEATAWVVAHPGEYLVRSDDPTYADQVAWCPPLPADGGV